jgi:hypothetical protein
MSLREVRSSFVRQEEDFIGQTDKERTNKCMNTYPLCQERVRRDGKHVDTVARVTFQRTKKDDAIVIILIIYC